MSRPVKAGLDYFPLDVDFATNAKTEAIMGEFGPKGVLTMIYLLSAVYRNGYYLQWDKLEQMQLVNRISGISSEMINQIVNRLIAYGTFNEELFNSAKVLTSLRIQETYLDATKRRKSQKPTLYWINADNNPTSTPVNVDINTQSKVKESKVNKTKTSTNKNDLNLREDFTTNVWPLFPKRQKFEDAYEAYKKALVTGTKREELIDGIKRYAEYIKVKRKGDGYTAAPDSWLEAKRWLDEYDMTPENPNSSKRNKGSFATSKPNDSFSDSDLPF